MRTVRTAWSEAVANVLGTPARFGLLAMAIAVSVLFVGWREASFVRQLEEDQRLRIQAGEFVSVVVGTSNDGTPKDISGIACDRLAQLPGIVAAGVVRPSGQGLVGSHPDGAYQVFEASPGFLQVVLYHGPAAETLVGSAAATELGLVDGSIVALSGNTLTVSTLAQSGVRTAQLDRSFLRVVPATAVAGTCYVEFRSMNYAQTAQLLSGLLDQRIQVSPLVTAASLGSPPADKYRNRFDKWLWLGISLVPLLPGALVTRSRRSELALYSILGTARSTISLILAFEWLILLVTVLTTCVPVLALTSGGAGDVAELSIRAVASEALLVYGTAVFYSVAAIVCRPSVYEVLRRAE